MNNSGWQIRKPIETTLEMDTDGEFIVFDELTYSLGFGDTPATAFADWFKDMTAYYKILEEHISDEYPENEIYLTAIKDYICRLPT